MRGGRCKIFRAGMMLRSKKYRLYHRDANGCIVAENDDAISASSYGLDDAPTYACGGMEDCKTLEIEFDGKRFAALMHSIAK